MAMERHRRRDFISQAAKVIAMAAGLSAVEVRRLLGVDGGGSSAPAEEYSVLQKSAEAKIKALKVLLENSLPVFENEYGRVTPLEKGYFDAKNPKSLITMCRVEWLQADEIVHDCRVVHAPGASCGTLVTCGGNACGEQDCPALRFCGGIGCGKQSCPLLGRSAGKPEWTNSSFYAQFRSDPYIQHLFRRFQATSAEELAAQVTRLLCR